jgi:uncharacterized membrane protein
MSSVSAEALAGPLSSSIAVSKSHAATRLESIDALRGLVIVLMALDHVRDYFTAAEFDVLDLSQTSFAYFMTRWITHLCAPTFIFLAGVSAYLMSKRMTTAELRRFLMTRGLWLIALEFTVVHFAWSFNLRYQDGLFMQVIWAIGASMVVLALIVSWPRWVIGIVAVGVIATHNLLDGIQPEAFGDWAPLWNLLHVQGPLSHAFVLYPLIPWVAVMALGFWAGAAFELEASARRRVLWASGVAALSLFVVLRAINLYGDPHPWEIQSNVLLTALSFIKVHKYPPSLMYLLIMLGTACILLAELERVKGTLRRVLVVFGRVPLFVYVLHIVFAHLAAGLLALVLGFGDALLTNVFIYKPAGWGFGLFGVYAAWLLIIIGLYPACRWYGALKRRRTQWWWGYL